jgi:hypothetical protein
MVVTKTRSVLLDYKTGLTCKISKAIRELSMLGELMGYKVVKKH